MVQPDPFEQLMDDALKPVAHFALAKRASIIVGSILCSMIDLLSLTPFRESGGAVSAMGLVTVVCAFVFLCSLAVTSMLYSLLRGDAVSADHLQGPPYRRYGLYDL